MSFTEVIANKYVLSAVGAVLALLFTYMYDKFERKEYSYMQYVKMAILGYIVSLMSVVVTRYAMGLEGNEFPLPFTSTPSTTQTGGSTVPPVNPTTFAEPPKPVSAPAPVQPTQVPQTITIDALDFKTGTPTF